MISILGRKLQIPTSHAYGGYAGGTGQGILWAGGGPGPAFIANSEV